MSDILSSESTAVYCVNR